MVIFDETFNAINNDLKKELISNVNDVFFDKCVVYISHEEVFKEYCDKIVIFENKMIEALSNEKEILS